MAQITAGFEFDPRPLRRQPARRRWRVSRRRVVAVPLISGTGRAPSPTNWPRIEAGEPVPCLAAGAHDDVTLGSGHDRDVTVSRRVQTASSWTAGAADGGWASAPTAAATARRQQAITEADIARGLYDGATVELWRVDWASRRWACGWGAGPSGGSREGGSQRSRGRWRRWAGRRADVPLAVRRGAGDAV